MTWYVVVDPDATDPAPDEKIWTISKNPGEPGWNTDSGFRGYGLTKADAEVLVAAANDEHAAINKLVAIMQEYRGALKQIRDFKSPDQFFEAVEIAKSVLRE